MSATTADRSALDEAQRHGQGDAQAGLTRRTRDELVTFLSEQGVRVSAGDNDAVFARYCEAYDQRSRQEDLVDAGSEMSPGPRRRILDAADYLAVAPEVVAVARDIDLAPYAAALPSEPADADLLEALAEEFNLGSPVRRLLAVLAGG